MTHNLVVFVIIHENIEVTGNSSKHFKKKSIPHLHIYTATNAQQGKANEPFHVTKVR